MKKLIVGTRGSMLALTQTKWLIERLKVAQKDIEIDIKVIKTKGDIIQNVSLEKIGDKGIFIKEIENELLNGDIDFAVHSMKDLPSEIDKRFLLATSPVREDAGDVLITRHNVKSILELPANCKIGTGSKRRSFQLKDIRKDINPVGIRGNVETRIKKIFSENLDGIVIAKAGINRLKITPKNLFLVDLEKSKFIPAPAQGILAIEILNGRVDLIELFKKISHDKTNIQGEMERTFLNELNGSCHIPVGAYCEIKESGENIFHYLYGDEEGRVLIKKSKKFLEFDGNNVAIMAAKEIKKEVEECLEKFI